MRRHLSMRLVVMGTGPFAVPSFEALSRDGHEIALVVTRPQPPVKSRRGAPPAPVRDWATAAGFDVYDPDSINTPDAIARVAAAQADLMVVCDYGQILKPDALATTPLGGINLHGSLLPAYRGAAPVQRALLSGDAVTGVSVIHMTPKLDGGPILVTRETPIDDDETSGELEVRLSEIGVSATIDAIEILANWDRESDIGSVQDSSQISKAPRLSKQEGNIDWTQASCAIDCHVRGMQPWPVAYTHVHTRPGKPPVRVQIKQIRIAGKVSGQPPGETVDAERFELPAGQLYVSTGDGIVEIVRLQPAGKKEMSGGEFMRGHQFPAGTKLSSE